MKTLALAACLLYSAAAAAAAVIVMRHTFEPAPGYREDQ